MDSKKVSKIDWLDPLKAFALLGVMLNHLVEVLCPGEWFTQPSGAWAGFPARVPVFISQDPLPLSLIKILAWLGDYCPGVFILASGFGLSWAVLHSEQGRLDSILGTYPAACGG